MTLHRRKTSDPATDARAVHRWILVGPNGATQFVAAEYPAGSELAQFADVTAGTVGWAGTDVGYHSPRPSYEDQTPMDSCDVLEGACYYDGSSLQARELVRAWVSAGQDDELIWSELEDRYAALFAGEQS